MTAIIDEADLDHRSGDHGSETADDHVDATRGGRRHRIDRRVRSVAMRPRRVIVKTHRWLSVALLAWLVVISTTGAWLVVHDAVESWIHPERYATTSGDIGLQAAVDSALVAAGDGSIVTNAQTQRNSRGVYKVSVIAPTEPPKPLAGGAEAPTEDRTYFVDPGSGRVNGAVVGDEGATWWLYRGHMHLWQDNGIFGVFDADSGWCRAAVGTDGTAGAEPGGARGVVCDVIPDGDDMVAWFAVGWMVVLATGFYLWYWPGVRRWATALVVTRRRGAFAFNMSVHKAVGLVALVPLFVITFTGAAFAFPNMKGWFENATPAQRGMDLWAAPEMTSDVVDGRAPMNMDDIADMVAQRHPQRAVDSITPPADETGTFTAWVTRGYTPWTREDSGGNVYMVFDQYTGETLYDGTPGEGNVFDQAWDDYNFPVHTGDFAGTTTRVLWVVVGLSPIVLAVTGVTMNRIRHRKRAARRNATTVSAS
jgi:uncharacterized iron-regulated membrane protein